MQLVGQSRKDICPVRAGFSFFQLTNQLANAF